MSNINSLELNEQFLQGLKYLENTKQHLFITGHAGTGKSTLLKHFRANTNKKIVVLAPTGVSAVNIQGQTIHSFFGFKPNTTANFIKRKKNNELFKQIDTIIIDEISMVRADLLDCIDKFLRLNGPDMSQPFGGIQMAFFGDLHQLPPIIRKEEEDFFYTFYDTPYFFSAHALQNVGIKLIELKHIYRQTDQKYIELLNKIRNNTIDTEDLKMINQRVTDINHSDLYIYLTPTNKHADTVNHVKLDAIKNKTHTFTAQVTGDCSKEYFPAPLNLQVKIGAQIMMLNNDPNNRWINGTIGKIAEVKEEHITIEFKEGEKYKITPFTWEISKFKIENNKLQAQVLGTFKQYPLMLAWAITIHKSQGKTFDKMVLDIGSGTFAFGQFYVALSRCTTLEGITLKKPIYKHHILSDIKIPHFLKKIAHSN